MLEKPELGRGSMMRWEFPSFARSLVCLASFLLAPLSALALKPASCDMQVIEEYPSSLWSYTPEDLGAGFVQQRHEAMNDGAATDFVTFEHCATSTWIRAIERRTGAQGAYQAPADPSGIMREAMASPQTFALQDVGDLLQANGIEAQIPSSDYESCGCAAFYPEQQGSKVPWWSE